MRWSIGPFGLKDLFTVINLLGGVAGIYFLADNRPDLAGYSLLVGYLFGDTLDGVVARLTRTSNDFGSEFDTATDHFVQAIVPAMIVFAVYARGDHRTLGAILMAVVILSATIRQALFSVAKMGDPLMYCGLPRTVSGYASMALVLSHLFEVGSPHTFAVGALLIPLFSILGLLPIPYMTHKGTRRMQWYVKPFVVAFLVTPPVSFFVAREFTFDWLFLWTAGYAALGWVPLRREERRSFFARYRIWRSEVVR